MKPGGFFISVGQQGALCLGSVWSGFCFFDTPCCCRDEGMLSQGDSMELVEAWGAGCACCVVEQAALAFRARG